MEEKKVIKVGLKTAIMYFIILLLAITLVVLLVYYNKIKPNNMKNLDNTVTAMETEEIKKFVGNIYFYSIDLPEFTDINKVNEDWIWNTVRSYASAKEHSQYITYNGIMTAAKEVFGENFSKKFPLEGRYGLTLYNDETVYDEDSAIYEYSYMEWAEDLWPCITVRDIKKENGKYLVTAVLYDVIDNGAFTSDEDVTIEIYDKNNEVIQTYEYRYDSERNSYLYNNRYYTWDELINELNMEEFVLKNNEKFVQKLLTLEKNEKTGKVYLKECKDI